MSEHGSSRRHLAGRVGRLLHRIEKVPGAKVLEQGAAVVGSQLEAGVDIVEERVGGPARLQVVVLLASVLGLASADTGAISAIAPKLEATLHIGNVAIGLLVTVSGLTAAAGMLPVGWVTDRWTRTRLVTGAAVLWGCAELASAVAPSYTFLLVVRLALGALTAVTGPTLASLTGDLFPARERSQVYGFILTGELLGAGGGLLIAGLFSSWFTWRVALAVLSLPSFVLAWQFHKRLPEPARGGQSRLERGAETIVAAEDVEAATDAAGSTTSLARDEAPAPRRDETDIVKEVRRRHIDPRQGVVLEQDPMELGWWESVRYVVAVRSNVTLIVASALGYFFFGGVETFALIYLEGHYRIGQSEATLVALGVGAAAVVGAVVGGRITDRLLHRGRIDARLVVPAAGFALAAAVFVPGVIPKSIFAAVPFFVVAGFCIAAPNPGLDAARLDIMPSRMWGRAEAVRSFLRSILQSFAPLVFGLVSTAFGGKDTGFGASGGGDKVAAAARHATGLEQTFLVMLATLVAAAVIVWSGRRSYPVDVAAATETERRFPPSSHDVSPAGQADDLHDAGVDEGEGGAARQPRRPFEQAEPRAG